MTNLNLAFIRAYKVRQQRDASQPAADGPSTLNPTDLPRVHSDVPDAGELYVAPPEGTLKTHRATPSPVPPVATAANQREDSFAVAGSISARSPRNDATTSTIQAPTRWSPSSDAGVGDVWKPAWEVDEFSISDCCKFIERHGECLNDVTLRIVAAAGTRKNVVSVRSWTRGEGRTTISVCLARKLANLGLNVVLVDADFDNPSLCQELGVNIESGLENVLRQEADLAEACVSSLEDSLTFVPLRSADVEWHEQRVQRQWVDIVNQLSNRYDIVLIDAGPGSQIWDQGIAARQVGVVVVRDERRAPSDKVEQLMTGMKRRRLPVLGLIENFSKAA
jgi:Mrp family chromosome partitioning ATPase